MHRCARPWGSWPRLGLLPLVLLLCLRAPGLAAYTEPRLALTRISVLRSSGAAASLRIEGTFSFADLLQLGLPVNIYVTQGTYVARLDGAGGVYTSSGGGPEQPGSGPGLVSLTPRELLAVLPAGFATGPATVRLEITYDGGPISTNTLAVTL